MCRAARLGTYVRCIWWDVRRMTDTQQPGTDASDSYEPGTVDENTHGWAPDAPETGEAKERVIEANQKAWETNDTQEAASGAARQGPDMTGGHVGESVTQRGEDVAEDEGTEPGRYDLPPQGQSQRPGGGSTSRTAPRVRRRSLGTARQGGADRGRDHRSRCASPGRFGALRAVRTARLNAAPPDDL